MTRERVSKESRASTREAVVACGQTFLFSLYPVLLGLQVSTGLPLGDQRIERSVFVALAVTALLLWALRLLTWSLAGRAAWLSWVLALFGFYVPAITASRAIGANVHIGHAGFSMAYALLSIAVATFIVRPWKTTSRDTVPLSIAAVVMLAVSAWPIISSLRASNAGQGAEQRTRIFEGASHLTRRAPADRDIYYVVLDGFGRSDVLGERYGEALDSFRGYLASRGFYVAEQAQSNYAQTFLSLSSTLNMTYLDELAVAMGPASDNRMPLQRLIQQNALMKLAKNAGYRVIAIGSDVMATSRLDAADVCYCELYGLREFEQAVVGMTPIAALPLGRWTYRAHYRKVLYSFAALEEATRLPGPKLVFAHILSPHPPFVLAPDGRFEPVLGGPVIFSDGDGFAGSPSQYVAGYRRQAQYVASRLREIVDRVLSKPGPPPVVVVHGDHGPGSMLHWNDPKATNMRERLGIFAAYHFPGSPDAELYPTITPVNAARVLSNRYLGADLPMLPDRSYFSTWARPFDLIPVAALPQ